MDLRSHGFTVLGAAFIVDVAMKFWVQAAPETAACFLLATPIGAIGIRPSVNNVLAFSLPVPNAWIWPIGWIVVLALIGALFRSTKYQAPPTLRSGQANSKQVPSTKSQIFNDRRLGIRYSNLFGIWNLSAYGGSAVGGEFGISDRHVAVLAVILGAVSNLFERTFFGGVTDYLAFTVLFPAFNIADLMVLVGIGAWWWTTRRHLAP
ncbi:MAG: signal peptidase II [Candidatus Uhrbacteria bacterium]